MFAFCFFFGWTLPLGSLLICAYSTLIITDKRIIIGNGARGRIYLVPLDKIAAVEMISQSAKCATLYGLYVYLLNQKRLHSALYYRKDEIEKVIEQLKSLGIKKYSDLKYHELHTQSSQSNDDLFKKYSFSYVLPILLTLLFLVPIIIFVYAQIAR